MRLSDLIERLEEYREQLGGDAEVRLMTQPSYPFENSIKGVCSAEDMEMEGDANVVYIVELKQLAYGSQVAWDVAF